VGTVPTLLPEGRPCRLRPVNDTLATVWCLDVLALIAYDDGRIERAATLLGVTTGLSHTAGVRPGLFPELAAHHRNYEQRARASLGERAYQTAFARGERLTVAEAVAYALDEAPARPAPATAASTSLTRRERQVADLIAQGLPNKEIAARLVISQRTAESHVEHILTKLGLANRAQVAAWAAQCTAGSRDG
jgi:DNA-binding CsgD family transcriptional regulator